MCTDDRRSASTPEPFATRLDRLQGGVLVVHASGRLDHTTAPDLRHLFDEQLAAAPSAIVLDVSSLSGVEPGTIPALVQVARRARDAGIGLCLVTVDGAVVRALAAAVVSELFDIYPSTEAALRTLI